MPAVTGATNKPVPFYHWPVGFSPSDRSNVTVKDIKEWEKKNDPNFIQSKSYLVLSGIAATVLGVIIGLFGLKQDNKLGKYCGGLLTLAGAASSAGGASASRRLYGKDVRVKDIEEIKKNITLLKDESLHDSKRYDAFRLLSPENYPEGYEAVLAFINEKSKDEGTNALRRVAIGYVASTSWPYITDEFKGERKKVIETLLACAKDVDDDSKVRRRAIDLLGERENNSGKWLFSNEEAIKILEVLKDILQKEGNQARVRNLNLDSAIECIEKRLVKDHGQDK